MKIQRESLDEFYGKEYRVKVTDFILVFLPPFVESLNVTVCLVPRPVCLTYRPEDGRQRCCKMSGDSTSLRLQPARGTLGQTAGRNGERRVEKL